MPKFPHLKESTAYPRIDNVDVYKNKNDFDYERYNKGLEIELCNVRWKSDYTDTVDWETEEKRDNYFSSITKKISLESAINKYPENGAINVPLPFNEVRKYNYLILTFDPLAAKDDFVDFETDDGITKYFFFIDSCEMAASNSTKCNIMLDVWTTYISRININYLMLQRGHAPLAAVDVDAYLKNPIENNTYLLAPDINYGTCDNVKTSADAILNDGEMFACVATLSDPRKTFGTKYAIGWQTPSYNFNKAQGVPSYFVFAMDTENLAAFMQNADDNIPQFKQTVQAIFFVSKKLVTSDSSFTFLNTTCYTLASSQKNMKLLDLKKEDFKYPKEYAHLTKLYTFPYAYVEISDASGQVLTVKIENTDGNISIEALLSIAFPHLGIDVFFGGVGGENERTIEFKNIDMRTVTIGGRWYEYFQHWDIPCFEVVQQASTNYDFNTHWKREQMKNDAETAYLNAYDAANTSRTNSTAHTSTAYTNSINTANTSLSNQTLANSANENNQLALNEQATYLMQVRNKTNQALQAYDAKLTERIKNNVKDSSTILDKIADAVVHAVGSGTQYLVAKGMSESSSTGATSYTNALQTQAIGNGIANVAADVAGGVGGVVINDEQYWAVVDNTQDHVNSVNVTNENNTNKMNATALANTYRSINAQTAQTTNNANTTKTNSANTKQTDIACFDRTFEQTTNNAQRTKANQYNSIENNIRQAKLNTPLTFGINKGNSADVTMPQMLTANLVTQSQGEIAQVANEFLRYGYNLGQQWSFNGFSVMKNFSYWKASEVWLYSENGVNNAILDYIRAILVKGTTVWENPDKVCSISIFDN